MMAIRGCIVLALTTADADWSMWAIVNEGRTRARAVSLRMREVSARGSSRRRMFLIDLEVFAAHL